MGHGRVSQAVTSALLFPALLAWSAIAAAQTPWRSMDVGSTGIAGSASEFNGTWAVSGAGSDVWGSNDAFQFVYSAANPRSGKLVARVDDLQPTNPFAKAGIMLRDSLSADAATVLLDVKPNGEVEFMARSSDGGEMSYIGGVFTGMPAWLQLWWENGTVVASTSLNGHDWNTLGETQASMTTQIQGSLQVGALVSSHDVTQPALAHFEGLSVLPNIWTSSDIGPTGVTGNAAYDFSANATTVEGAGADIWGTADSFQFVHQNAMATVFGLDGKVVSLANTGPFAKAGLMFRESLAPNAVSVILDVKPDGGIEFMARTCTGCQTTFLAGASLAFPAILRLERNGSTITASVGSDKASMVQIGSVDLGLPDSIEIGLAVTSHDSSQVTLAAFGNPATP